MARELYVLAGLAPLGSEGAGGRLLVDLEEPWAGTVLSILSAAGHDAVRREPSQALLSRVADGGYRVLVTHARGVGDALDAVRQVHVASPTTSVILLGLDPTVEGRAG